MKISCCLSSVYERLAISANRMMVTRRAAGPMPWPMTSWRYIDPGIMRKPMNIAPMTVFQPKPSSKWLGGLTRSRYV